MRREISSVKKEMVVGTRKRAKGGGCDRGGRIRRSGSNKVPGKTPVRKSCQAVDSGLSVSCRKRTAKETLQIYLSIRSNINLLLGTICNLVITLLTLKYHMYIFNVQWY